MVCICIWLQVTQNPYSSEVPAKETSSHMRRQRQTGPDPVQSSSPFIRTRVLSSISSNMLFPFGFPGVSTVLTEKALVATRSEVVPVSASQLHTRASRRTQKILPLSKPTSRFPSLGRKWVTWPFLNQSLARGGWGG